MLYNYKFRDINEGLPMLLDRLGAPATSEIGSRVGRCKEMTHVGIALNEPWRREILLDHRKPNLAAQIAETMWVLAGRDDMEFLSHYLPRAKDFSDDGETWRAGYGARLRNWGPGGTDQLAKVVRLLKEDPMTRRAVMSIWDPSLDYADSKDIPCNNWLSFSCRLGYLDLMVGIRSNDIIWGWSGINAFEWSVLLEVVAGLVGVKVGKLHFATTSLHMYEQHYDKAKRIVETSHASLPSDLLLDPIRFDFGQACAYPDNVEGLDKLIERWFRVEQGIRTGVPAWSGAVDRFPEPMMRAWLRVLQWWWSGGDRSYLEPIKGSTLEAGTHFSVQRPKAATELVTVDLSAAPELVVEEDAPEPPVSDFIQFAINTHLEKHAAYGDSWKKRGEMLGIMANIARKIDRLGKGKTSDETSADTAMDLMVYLAKYQTWLRDQLFGSSNHADDPAFANEVLISVEKNIDGRKMTSAEAAEEWLVSTFDKSLESAVKHQWASRVTIVRDMLDVSYLLARQLWDAENGDQYRGADAD